VSVLWKKALGAARAARRLNRDGSYDDACSRAYYALFNAARTLLILRGHPSSEAKTHATALRLFSQEFVLTGLFDAEDGRALREAAETRKLADYSDSLVAEQEAAAVIASMDKFIVTAERIVSRRG
jgi:uncharacterized protein (UPF0332 family)